MSKFRTSIAVLAIATLPALAFAQATPATPAGSTPGVAKRQANQERRIEQGVKSGQLTDKEAARLEKREAKIESDKLAAKADGKVTPQERKHLQRELNQTSRAIAREKHDNQHK